MTRYKIDYNTWVILVPGGLLFRSSDVVKDGNGTAMCFVPCKDTEAANFVLGLERVS
jgi:hypothetical protein